VSAAAPRPGDIATITVSGVELVSYGSRTVEFLLQLASGTLVFRLPLDDAYCSVQVEVDPVDPQLGDLWCTETPLPGEAPMRLFARDASADGEVYGTRIVLVNEHGFEYTPQVARDLFGRLVLLSRRYDQQPHDTHLATPLSAYVTEVLPIAEETAAAMEHTVAVPVVRPASGLPSPDRPPLDLAAPAATMVLPVPPAEGGVR
jgi:hypothetical protein